MDSSVSSIPDAVVEVPESHLLEQGALLAVWYESIKALIKSVLFIYFLMFHSFCSFEILNSLINRLIRMYDVRTFPCHCHSFGVGLISCNILEYGSVLSLGKK
jgi:hypothetical protein